MELDLPLACTPAADCWVTRLVDHDPGPGFTDYRCGTLGSDGHEGTDFAIADPHRMAEGVPVTASAPGVVAGVRDGMPDQPPEGRLAYEFGDRNCGNGVLLRHADGWETQYCHLRQGSVQVVRGDTVAAGQPLGLVGMSGEANFPHVHLSVRRDGKNIDPFTGGSSGEACGAAASTLWAPELRSRLAYEEVPIAVVGLSDHLPDRDAIVAGRAGADRLSGASPALVGYVLAYGLRKGDRLELVVEGPEGRQVSSAGFDLDEDAPQATRAAGRRRPSEGWPPGIYRVEARIGRGDRSFARSASFTVAQ
ncbi:MAG: M23 family metallopeptidase [Geminicoccaceae bacterium]